MGRHVTLNSMGLALLSLACLGVRAQPPPPDAFGTVSRAQDVALSPDGNSAAWFDAGAKLARIIVYDLANNRDRRIFEAPADTKLRRLTWIDNDTVLYCASGTINDGWNRELWEAFRCYAADLWSGKSTILFAMDQKHPTVRSFLVSTRSSKPHTVLMMGWEVRRVPALYEVDTRTGNGIPVEDGVTGTVQFVVDPQGVVLARLDWKAKTKTFDLMAKRDGSWARIQTIAEKKPFALHGVTPDRQAVIALTPGDDDREKLVALPLVGSPAKVLVEDPARDVVGVELDRFDDTPIGAVLGGAKPEYRWLTPGFASRQQKLAAAFPGRTVALYGRSEDGQRMIARVSGPDFPAVYYLVDYRSHHADILAEEYPQLAHVKLGTVEAITYKARDGTDIPAYVTMPPGAAAGPQPMVVLPHGGPHAHDEYDFDWWAQFLATRGYVVLQPQFRGSTNYGAAFAKAGIREWGGLMQDDITDGVRAMVEQHIADPRRVCIVGASYGGYAALAGVAFTPELYACAVSVSGISDLPLFIVHPASPEALGGGSAQGRIEEIGHPNDVRTAAKSPARMAHQVKVPVLLIHGVGDSVVPADQSLVMETALRRVGVPVRFVKLRGEDHWLSRSETRTVMLSEVENFLKPLLAP